MIGDPEDHPTEPNEKNIDAPNEIPIPDDDDEDDPEQDDPEQDDPEK